MQSVEPPIPGLSRPKRLRMQTAGMRSWARSLLPLKPMPGRYGFANNATIMLKNLAFAAAFCALSAEALAAEYYVVVPVPNRTSNAPITVALNAYTLPTATVGSPYTGFDFKSVLQVAGDPKYSSSGVSFSLSGGTLPEGLVLNTDGTLTGTATASGTHAFTVKATYKTKSGEQAYEVVSVSITVALSAGNPGDALVGSAYYYDLKPKVTVSGDPAYAASGLTWETLSSTLPAGLTLQPDGTIRGTPTAAGTGTLTARVSYKGVSGEKTYQVVSVSVTSAIALAFDGTSGSTTFTDSSGKYTVTPSGAAKLTDVSSVSGGTSLWLDGSANTQVNIPAAAMPSGTQNFTIEGWIYLLGASSGDGAPILSQYAWYDNTNSSMTLIVQPSRTLSFAFTNTNSSSAYLPQYQVGGNSGAVTIPLAQWAHFALVRSGGTFTLYIQGKPAVSASHATGSSFSVSPSTRSAVLGYHSASIGGSPSRLKAYLDNVRIVRGAALYREAFTPATSLQAPAP